MHSFHLFLITLAALTSAGPIPQQQVAAAPAVVAAIPAVAATPAIPAAVTQFQDPAPRPLEFDFGGSSQYSQQELRRRQRKFLEQMGTFQKSPYGSGAVPVPDNSADSGFGGSTLF